MPIDEKSIKRFEMRPALIVFIVCLVVGWSVVGFLAARRGEEARKVAQIRAQAAASALEVQMQQAITAAEALAAVSRLNNGPVPNFQKIAAELQQTRPALAFLELQPNGVVSEIYPMSNSAIGFNVLNDPLYRIGAYSAIQSRQLTVSGVLNLHSKERGLVARVPIFIRMRDGREAFWGFVSASMRWPAAADLAHLYELNKSQGYDYILIRSATAQEKAFKIDGNLSDRQNAVVQPIRAANAEFKLALKRQGGWVSITRIIFEGLVVVIVAGLLCLVVNLLENREALENSLNEMNQRLARESTQRQQALEECQNTRDEAASIQTELKDTQTARQEADSKIAEFQARLRSATEGKEAALAKLKQAEASIIELQARLDAALKKNEETVLARKAEREEARVTIEQAQKTISEMQARLEAGSSADKNAAAGLQTQLEKAQTIITDLQGRVETAEAGVAKLKQAEKKVEALQEKLQAAEEAEAKVAAVTALLEQTQAELVALQNSQKTGATEITPLAVETPEIEPEPPAKVEEPIAEAETTEAKKMPLSPAEPEAVPNKPPKRKKARRDDQMDFFSEPPAVQAGVPNLPEEKETPTPSVEAAPIMEASSEEVEVTVGETKPEKPARRLPPPPPLDEAEFRKAVHEMLPLLADRDPGAKDCLKANRITFRSGFSAEGYEEFERAVKGGHYDAALELLRKAGRRHGVSV